MGDLLPSIPKSTFASELDAHNWSVVGLDEYNTDDDLAAVELFKEYPEALLRFASICCVLFMLVGIPGNMITIIALARCKKVRNATAVFIMNLSCSDLLFCCFNLPLAASTFWRRSWAHGRTLCRMFPLARYALVAVSLFTVLAITINRYVMISHPRLYPKLYKRQYLVIMVASTWIFSFGALIATWLEKWGRFGLDPTIGSCSILPDKNKRSPKEFLFVGAFMLPCLAIVICYARIFCIVREAARKSRAPVCGRPRGILEDSAVGSASTALERSPGPENGISHVAPTRRALLAPPVLHCPPTPAPERSSSSGVDTLDGHDEECVLDSKLRTTSGGDTTKRLRQAAVALKRSPATVRPPRLTHKDRKLLKMIMAIMLSFWVCYLPITLTKIFREFTSHPAANIADERLMTMDLLTSSANGTAVNVSGSIVLGLDEYGSDEALAAVELFKNYPEGLLKFATVCCVLFMLVGIPGNIITIVALARCKKVRNATALFIINLSISDLLFCCFNLPLAGSTFWTESWIHGRTLCRLFPMVRYALVAVSLFTILAITINRYIMISHPLLYPRLYTKMNLILMMAVIWIFSFGALFTTWFEVWGRFSLEPSIGSCTIVPDKHGKSPKKYLFIFAFLLPGLAIIICYARIFWIVKKVGKKSRASIRLRPRPTTEIIPTEVQSRDNVETENRPASLNLPNKLYTQRINCLCTFSSENSSCSGGESYTQDEYNRKMSSSNNRFKSSNETIRKIKVAFTNTRQPVAPKPLLPTRKDKKLRTMIMAIMLAFGLCHLPISVTKIFLEFTPHPVLKIISYILLYLTTCINPIIYVVMSNEYRQAYKNLITCRPQVKDMTESTGMKIINGLNKSFRKSERRVRLKNTQEPV
ncbi:uncharacterized protein ACR2FA_008522 [Aphomia sociella]